MFVDLKLNYMNEEEKDFQQCIREEPVSAGKKQKKGQEFETLPFFLSDEFKTLLEEKVRGIGGPNDGTLGTTQPLS